MKHAFEMASGGMTYMTFHYHWFRYSNNIKGINSTIFRGYSVGTTNLGDLLSTPL
jgi:hypothetical protein